MATRVTGWSYMRFAKERGPEGVGDTIPALLESWSGLPVTCAPFEEQGRGAAHAYRRDGPPHAPPPALHFLHIFFYHRSCHITPIALHPCTSRWPAASLTLWLKLAGDHGMNLPEAIRARAELSLDPRVRTALGLFWSTRMANDDRSAGKTELGFEVPSYTTFSPAPKAIERESAGPRPLPQPPPSQEYYHIHSLLQMALYGTAISRHGEGKGG